MIPMRPPPVSSRNSRLERTETRAPFSVPLLPLEGSSSTLLPLPLPYSPIPIALRERPRKRPRTDSRAKVRSMGMLTMCCLHLSPSWSSQLRLSPSNVDPPVFSVFILTIRLVYVLFSQPPLELLSTNKLIAEIYVSRP